MAMNTSSYLIDSSKKCYIPGGPVVESPLSTEKNPIYIPAILFGDVDTKSLQDLGFEVSENFKEASKEAAATMDKLLKILTVTMNAVIKQIPIFKNVKFELNSEKIRDTAVFFKVALGMLGKKEQGKEIHDLLTSIGSQAYRYNVPMRMSAPDFVPANGGKITINFAYGKCNYFSAKQEVWLPLCSLKNAYFPRVSAGLNEGLASIVGGARVPYPQEVSGKVLTHLFNPAKNTVLDITAAAKSLGDMASRLGSYEGEIRIKETSEDRIKNKNEYEDVKNKYAYIFDKVPGTVTDTESDLAGKSAAGAARAAVGTWDESKGANNGKVIDDKDSEVSAAVIAREMTDAGMEATRSIAFETKKQMKVPSREFISGIKMPLFMSEKDHVKLVEAKGEKRIDLDTIIADLVTFVPKQTGLVLSELMKESVGGTVSLQFGYPSVYKTSLEEIKDLIVPKKIEKTVAPAEKDEKATPSETVDGKIYVYESKLDPKVTIRNVLLQKFSVKFDFSHTDEYGYPMSGKFCIEKMWNVNFPGYTLYMAQNAGRASALTESYIDYPEAERN